MSKKIYFMMFFCVIMLGAQAQTLKKYQGLLWEISGKGLAKPSYLYGTMHVSSKVAFHLDDSFFKAIENCDVVALEINADSFMEDYMKSERMEGGGSYSRFGISEAEDFTLYNKKSEMIQRALSLDQNVVNFLMYRSSGYRDNFEEDTYLDLYIYRTGKKLKKTHFGVENWDESERLMKEAQEESSDEPYDPKKRRAANKMDLNKELVDAYRKGDLDMLDSIHHLEDGEKYMEKAIYQRNRNMVASMDSVYKTGKTLFTAVGAAHLPGKNGIIEYLREKGYTVRAVTHIEKNSKKREKIDQIKFPLVFNQQTSSDGFFKVDVPGKLYETSSRGKMQLYLNTELVNGVYFDISRLKLFAPFIGKSQEFIQKKIDSLLFENIPGKILQMNSIKKSNYPALDIVNQTRKGDLQRYQIIITPLEVLIFKMAGNNMLVKGKEGDRFFNSIEIRNVEDIKWSKFDYHEHGFSVQLPHQPISNETSDEYRTPSGRLDYLAYDKNTSNAYLILHKSYNNLSYLEEDSFELNQMMDGFAQTEDFKEIKRENILFKGKQALKSTFKLGERNIEALAVIYGVNYYIFSQSTDQSFDPKFFESIEFHKPEYNTFETYTDTSFYYTVKTPYVPKKSGESNYSYYNSFRKKQGPHESESKSQVFTPKESEEGIRVEYYRYGKYISAIDTSYFRRLISNNMNDSDLYVISKSEKSNGVEHVYEVTYGDTATSKRHQYKFILKGSVLYTIQTVYDSTIGKSEFIQTFFNTFKTTDTVVGRPLFVSKADSLIKDLFSQDSATKQQAIESISSVLLTEEFYQKWMKAVDSFYCTKNYLEKKADLIEELSYGWIRKKRNADILKFYKDLYTKVGDTTTLQIAILRSLARFQSKESFGELKRILLDEAPIPSSSYDINGIFYNADDSFPLSKLLYPDLLKITSIDEYKFNIYDLMASLVDSNYLNFSEYIAYKTQIYNDARIALKRYQAKEENKNSYDGGSSNSEDELVNYTYILLPFYQEPSIKKLIDKQFSIKKVEFKMRIAIGMTKSKISVADSIWNEIAADEFNRFKLYNRLKQIKRLDLFPKKYLSQELIAQSLFMNQAVGSYSSNYYEENSIENENKKDSVVGIYKKEVTFRNKTGNIYMFKVLKKNEKNNEWYIGISGMQPTDTTKIETSSLLTSNNTELFDENKSIEEQFEELWNSMRLKRRRGGNSYYGYNGNGY